MNDEKDVLKRILVNVGDLGFKRRVLEIVKNLDLKENDKVLDCGCGEGFYLMVLNSLFPKLKITGYDNDAKMLSKAGKWLKGKKNIQIINGDICKIPFKNKTFDKIILSEVLEHLNDDYSALLEVKRILKPGGKVVITVPNHNYPFFWDPLNWTRERLGLGHFNKDIELLAGLWSMHLRLYYPKELESLAKKAGFKIEKIKILTHYCLPFTQVILHLGKNFYTKLPVPKSVVNTMEKFNWKKASTKKSLNILRVGLKIFEKVDLFNEKNNFGLDKSSLGILLVLQKYL